VVNEAFLMMRVQQHYCLFDTAIGPCGVAWTDEGLTHLQLPEADRVATERRLAKSARCDAPDAPPESVAQAIASIRDYFAGQPVDFSSVLLDLNDVPPFHRKVYEAARRIGFGRTASYGALAQKLDAPGAARAVGQALAHNPLPIVVPCHRVLASGNLGGFSAFGGAAMKRRLLALEGVHIGDDAPRLPGL
jgi:methylated-DNA-[protein]-cysteine S-methyltransferase